jgi:hypothetical protein
MPYTFRAGDLPKLDLDVDRGSDFLAWEKQWNSYRMLSGLVGSDAATQVHALHFCMSRETLTIVENLGLTDDQRADQAQIITGLKRYVQGRVNVTVERRNFRQRKQASGETFDDYVVSLRELAKTGNFCNNRCYRNYLLWPAPSKRDCKRLDDDCMRLDDDCKRLDDDCKRLVADNVMDVLLFAEREFWSWQQ